MSRTTTFPLATLEGEMAEVDEKFVSVAEAARLLHVSISTVWRWINNEELPAYRFGHKRILVKQSDLDPMIAPARQGGRKGGAMAQRERSRERPLTGQEKERWSAAIDEAKRFQAEMLARRQGKRFASSADVLDELRDERSRALE